VASVDTIFSRVDGGALILAQVSGEILEDSLGFPVRTKSE
jgi:hypothetical protein